MIQLRDRRPWIIETATMTIIHLGDRTYAIPREPLQCGNCLVMSGVFVNWHSDTVCVPCHDLAEQLFIQRQ